VALISSKNLAAPLTNKIHITSIILVALLFAVFRLAGGGVDVKASLKETFKKEQAEIMQAGKAAVRGQTAQPRSPLEDLLKPSGQTQGTNEVVPNRLGGAAVPPWQRQAQKAPAPAAPSANAGTTDSGEATSLDDIRRMLNSK
jgi:hypothetical protein